MDDNSSLKQFLDELSSYGDGEPGSGHVPMVPTGPLPVIGQVVEIAGSGSQVSMDTAPLVALASHPDQSLAMSGQVGSQVKMKVAGAWLIANVRTLRVGEAGKVVANVDFLGEGSEGKITAASPPAYR